MKHNIASSKDYQQARILIRAGKGCAITCNRGFGVVPQPMWVVAREQPWDRSTQVSLSLWMKSQLELYPGCKFVVATLPRTTKI